MINTLICSDYIDEYFFSAELNAILEKVTDLELIISENSNLEILYRARYLRKLKLHGYCPDDLPRMIYYSLECTNGRLVFFKSLKD